MPGFVSCAAKKQLINCLNLTEVGCYIYTIGLYRLPAFLKVVKSRFDVGLLTAGRRLVDGGDMAA